MSSKDRVIHGFLPNISYIKIPKTRFWPRVYKDNKVKTRSHRLKPILETEQILCWKFCRGKLTSWWVFYPPSLPSLLHFFLLSFPSIRDLHLDDHLSFCYSSLGLSRMVISNQRQTIIARFIPSMLKHSGCIKKRFLCL